MLLEADRLTLGLEGGCELELLDLRMSPDIFCCGFGGSCQRLACRLGLNSKDKLERPLKS